MSIPKKAILENEKIAKRICKTYGYRLSIKDDKQKQEIEIEIKNLRKSTYPVPLVYNKETEEFQVLNKEYGTLPPDAFFTYVSEVENACEMLKKLERFV